MPRSEHGRRMNQDTITWTSRSTDNRKRWQLFLHEGAFRLVTERGDRIFRGDQLSLLHLKRSWFRHVLTVQEEPVLRLARLRSRDAGTLADALERARSRHALAEQIDLVTSWAKTAVEVADSGTRAGRWITTEQVAALHRKRPHLPERKTLAQMLAAGENLLDASERAAFELCSSDLNEWIATINETITHAELEANRSLLDKVESSPLTNEQARAVVCFDNRVNLIASAGSGKTSVMVARAAYAIHRKFVAPQRVLLLAFNKDAAAELKERVTVRLAAVGLPTNDITATTFHSFGLSLIGRATGKKPTLAPWLEFGQDTETIATIVDELRDSSLQFRFNYDTFRLLYARTTAESDGGEPDAWDAERRETGFKTYSGHIVRSQGEKVIADYLFLSGVNFEYERRYPHVDADANHAGYRPDFYYPEVDAWHEHWALDEHGEPPDAFTGYASEMVWKKDTHQRFQTTLIETTWAEIMGVGGVAALDQKLRHAGLKTDWNPDRAVHDRWAQPPTHEDMAKLFRTFMSHVKSNSLSPVQVSSKLKGNPAWNTARTKHFLANYWPIHDAWQHKLLAEECVDFEDMLVTAADLLDAGTAPQDYDLVLVDEFQDASQARARLARGLVAGPGKYLLTVGDDWQAINRFAGADISMMTQFESWFGTGPTLYLTTTFRCTQEICDVSSAFVAKNPAQIGKTVRAHRGLGGSPIRVHYAASKEAPAITDAITACLEQIAERERSKAPPWEDRDECLRDVSVFVLGRYGFERKAMPRSTPGEMAVTFRTVHSAKGLEADYVIVANMTRGRYGFPSEMADDPVLDVAMATPDPFEHAEERRLFYVALTRAREQAFLITAPGHESIFITELVDQGHVEVVGTDTATGAITARAVQVCPDCGTGVLIARNGKFGQFYGCSTYPRCRRTQNSLPT